MSIRDVAFLSVVLSLATTVVLKALMVGLMAAVRDKPPLDRALTWNQAALMVERVLWLTILLAPSIYAREPTWPILTVWIVVSMWVLLTDGNVLSALWRDRIGPWCRDRWQRRRSC